MKRAIIGILMAVVAVVPVLFIPAPGRSAAPTATAIFAGGCFWCMEPPFDKVEGVLSTTSGYIGGKVADPSYQAVSGGSTGHAEALRVIYDPTKVSYARLLDVFWHNVDPLDAGGQFCDRGDQYRAEIFTLDEEQKQLAEQSKAAIEQSGRFPRPIVTKIVPATTFYPAEEYHQDFYRKEPARYYSYRTGCGRDRRLAELWGADKSGATR